MRVAFLSTIALFGNGAICGPFIAGITPSTVLVPRQTAPACNFMPTDAVPQICSLNLGTYNPEFGAMPTTISSPLASPPPSFVGSSVVPSVAAPSCSMQNADPDQGIDKAYCICVLGTLTTTASPLATIPITAGPGASCSYTTMPRITAVVTPTVDLGPAYTNSALCQVCTPYANNEDDCTTIPNCLPQAAAADVQAGNSPIHVGTLTGTALYTSVSSVLEALCPSVTQTESPTVCASDTVAIEGISYIDAGSLATDGELMVHVHAGGYNSASLRDAMIQSIAITIQQSAAGNNCYTTEYEVEQLRKRGHGILGLFERDRPSHTTETIIMCNAVEFAAVLYYNQYWRLAATPGPSDYIYAEWTFTTGPHGAFACDFLEVLGDALAAVQPEFAVGDVELGKELQAVCTGGC